MSKATPQPSESAGLGRKAIVHVSETHQMTGVVRDEHFHVEDVIHEGVSEASLGDRPRFRPIALSEIAEKGSTVEYID